MPVETLLPPQSVFGFIADRVGPVSAAEFERREPEAESPLELIEGWVMPMSPGNYRTGRAIPSLCALLEPLAVERGWELLVDARHELPLPPETVLFPDLALHCGAVEATTALGTVRRVPDLVVELSSEATAGRDRGPLGAKFLAYQMSGVREYYCAWPDGHDAVGYRLVDGLFVPLVADEAGFFPSPLLGRAFRPVPAGLGA